jgi:hypothetical protein
MVQEAFLNITHVSIDFTLKNLSGLLHVTGFNRHPKKELACGHGNF